MNNILPVMWAFAAFYALLAVIVAAGIRRFHGNILSLPEPLPFISIIVCARNEERSLNRCLDSLERLDYPVDSREIVIVDDESEDGTPAIAQEFAGRVPNVRILSTAGEPTTLTGKQRALDFGIRSSSGEFIFLTDADCTVDPQWIKRHLESYGENTGIVAGITGVESTSCGLLPRLQECDQISKLSIAKGAAGLGFPLTVMGNDISFRRAAWDACGGYSSIGPSIVEDVDLMLAITGDTPYELRWTGFSGSSVTTLPLESFRDFISQRRRMLRINRGIPPAGRMLFGVEFLMTALLAAAIVRIPEALPALLVSWTAGQMIILTAAMGFRMKYLLTIPAMLLFQTVYGVMLGVSMLINRQGIVWKERRYGASSG